MYIQLGDSVRVGEQKSVGIVERRNANILTVRFPDNDNRREQVPRSDLRPLAVAMFEARERGGNGTEEVRVFRTVRGRSGGEG